jgi:thiosulfate reductase cytochrome b subunit
VAQQIVDSQSMTAAVGVGASRHPAFVRVTHWINAVSTLALMVSGVAILLAHPRLYWGETGAVGTPSLIDLPLPFMLTGQSGWGRSLHFLSAWICVLTGGLYVIVGALTRHVQRDVLPTSADLSRQSLAHAFADHLHLRFTHGADETAYNVLQRLAYSGVVFVLFPLMIWSGLAMSPAITSVFPVLVTALGGQQSARTIHFFTASAIALFVIGHLVMVSVSGFTARMRMMILGGSRARKAAA